MRAPSKAEWLVIAVIVAALVAVAPPTPHWRETKHESCDLCGNCRMTVRSFRWWRLDSETIVPTVVLPVPDGHRHDWWQYSSSYVSYNRKWVADKPSRYRDGRMTWAP